MNDHPHDQSPEERAELLGRAAGSIPVAPLDTLGVVRRARAQRRRRTALSAAAAVVLVAGGSAAATQLTPDRPVGPAGPATAPTDASAPAQPDPVPAPPAGTRWVGQLGTVVAVPTDWPVDDLTCGPTPHSVGAGSTELCAGVDTDGGGSARVIIAPAGSSKRWGPVDLCAATLVPICGGDIEQGGVLVRANVQATDAVEQAQSILDSATDLPDGWTTVPFATDTTWQERQAAYEAAGFEVVVEDADRILGNDVVISPELGTPIVEGGTITLSPAAGSPSR